MTFLGGIVYCMQKIEVVVRITKDYCPPQEQTIFEWIETNRAAPDTLNYPGLEINLEHRRVFKNGQEVYMSRYEYGVLSLMARHPGQLFTKEQIFEAVWHQDSESCLTAVTNTIGRIRQKIEDDRAVPVYIRTISNLGYQFMPNISVKKDCNGVQREHNKKLNNGLPILHKVPPKRDYGRYFCIMAEKGGTSHGGLTEKLSPFFHAKKQEVNAYGR